MEKIYKLPFETDELVEFLSEDDLCDKIINVSLKNSELSEENFLFYINNLNLNVNLVDLDISYESKENLINQYFSIPHYFYLKQLVSTMVSILYTYYKIDKKEDSILSEEETNKYIENNKEFLNKIILFLDSIDLCFLTLDSKDAKDKIKNSLPEEDIIDDRHFIGSNISWILSVPGFYCYYLVDREFKKKYFVYQFEEFIYSNKCLADVLIHNNSEIGFIYNLYGDIDKICQDFIKNETDNESNE